MFGACTSAPHGTAVVSTGATLVTPTSTRHTSNVTDLLGTPALIIHGVVVEPLPDRIARDAVLSIIAGWAPSFRAADEEPIIVRNLDHLAQGDASGTAVLVLWPNPERGKIKAFAHGRTGPIAYDA